MGKRARRTITTKSKNQNVISQDVTCTDKKEDALEEKVFIRSSLHTEGGKVFLKDRLRMSSQNLLSTQKPLFSN